MRVLMFKSQLFREKKKKFKFDLLFIFGIIALVVLVSVFVYYAYIFRNFKIEPHVEHFAQFGDFIGGILNPIFAFLAFIALLYTIKLQSKALKLSKDELSATREELKESRIAQQEQSDSLKLQNKSTNQQIFENTFFQLLEQHNQYLDLMISDNKICYTHNEPNEFGIVRPVKEIEIEEIKLEFKKINQDKRSIKNYFMTLYQLLKFVHEKTKFYDLDGKFYTNIVRALVDDEVLRTLALNCISYDFEEYKELIEEYAFFEHIYIKEDTIETRTILNILSLFKPKAFGSNDRLKELIKSTSAKAKDL